jgi:hypothetical protein
MPLADCDPRAPGLLPRGIEGAARLLTQILPLPQYAAGKRSGLRDETGPLPVIEMGALHRGHHHGRLIVEEKMDQAQRLQAGSQLYDRSDALGYGYVRTKHRKRVDYPVKLGVLVRGAAPPVELGQQVDALPP